MRAFALAAYVTVLAGLPAPGLADEPPLRVGVVPESPPFVVTGGGALSGFTIDLFRDIGTRLKREVAFVQAPMPQLMADLAAQKVDVLAGPIQATPDRSANMLFTEGYIWSEYQFGSRHGQAIHGLADLRGKRLAVRAGSAYADWAMRNAARYGFSVVPARSGEDAATAVSRHEADVSLTGSPVQSYAAAHQANYVAGLSLPETRTHESAATRTSDVDLRDEIEDALRCLKQNGTVARLSKQWFGHEPAPEDLENLVVPGYGVPGLAGYDPKPQKPRC